MAVNNYKQDEEKTKFSWANIIRIMEFVNPYKKELINAVLIGIFASILLLFIPKIIAYAIDVSFVNKDFLGIVLLTLVMLILVIFSCLLTRIRRDKINTILNKVANDLKIAIFKKVQYLPHSYFDTHSHGKLFTRVSTYPDEASVIVCYVLLELILEVINLVFIIIFMLLTNVKLSLISIGLALLLTGVFIFIAPIRRKLQHNLNNKISNVNAYVSESLNGIRITQSFNREAKNESILRSLEKERLNANRSILFIGNLNWSFSGILNFISMALIYYIGLKYMYPAVSLGVILAIDSYSSRFWGPLEYLTTSYNDIMDASTYLERIFELLDEDEIIKNSSKAKELDIKGDLEFRNVNFGYNESKLVLECLNIKIKSGSKVGLVGETGCGKSTILSLISRFYDVSGGEILIDNTDIRDIKLESLRGQVSVMLQDNFLFARSVYENLVLNKKVSMDEVIKVCKLLDIHDMIMSLDEGYDTILLNNGSNLSSGQRQLLCIGRIMIQNPKILILDEATSNIDLKTEKQITKALDIVTKNRTTIMVAHRISTIKNCDKIILIKNHENAEEGTHKELIKKKGEYYKLYSRQAMD